MDEQEANQVAEFVMQIPESPKAAYEERGWRGLAIQRQVTAEMGPAPTPLVVNQVLASGHGCPLDAASRSFFEPRFGRDFGQVQIHNDATAHRIAKALNAEAFTFGDHIAFAAGRYAPGSQAGTHLLAHELTHVVQQSRGLQFRRIQRQLSPGLESESTVDMPPNLKDLSRAERRLARFEYKDKLAEIKAELHGEKYTSKLGNLEAKDYHELEVLAAEIAGGCRDGICNDERWELIQLIINLLLADPIEPTTGDQPPQATVRETYRAPDLELDFVSEPGYVVVSGLNLPTAHIPIVEITTVIEKPQIVVVQPPEPKLPDPFEEPIYVDYPPPFPIVRPPPDSDAVAIEWGQLEEIKIGGFSGGLLDDASKKEAEIEIDTLFDPSSWNPLSAKIAADSEGAWLVVEVKPQLGQLLELPGTKIKLPLKFCKDCDTPWSWGMPPDFGGLIEGADEARLQRYFELEEEYLRTGRRPLDPLIDMQIHELP
jgi:hypothetical protein